MGIRRNSRQLGEFLATAICGNDIFSSATYVSAIAAIFAGIYAPLVLLAVAGALFLFRSVYREVVEALPVNGGAYNALLNSTAKPAAALAGVLTLLSYTATAVISAKTAVEYLFFLFHEVLPARYSALIDALAHLRPTAVVLILLVFALLVTAGVRDSAKVAAGIFVVHVVSIIALLAAAAAAVAIDGTSHLAENAAATAGIVSRSGGLLPMLFFAFSVSLLGISGFESAANFVEEQAPGVFRKVLRNMSWGVAVVNPLLPLATLALLPLGEIAAGKEVVLAKVAEAAGGTPFLALVAGDAFLVLCGAVLTSFVGLSGLVKRMALDGCLPSFLGRPSGKGSRAAAPLTFFVLCTSIYALTHGDLLALAGVYTVSFLGVMSIFAVGNLVLRRTRPELKRPYRAPFIAVLLAGGVGAAGLIGNVAIDGRNAIYFLTYFVPASMLVLIMVNRRELYANLRGIFASIPRLSAFFDRLHERSVRAPVYAFLHDAASLYPMLDYINKNESSHHVTFLHCRDTAGSDARHRAEIKTLLPALKRAGVFPHLNIVFKYLPKKYGPDTIRRFAAENRVPLNRIFVGTIREAHQFEYADFGGVRIVL